MPWNTDTDSEEEGCLWPIDLVDPCTDDVEQQYLAKQFAAEILWAATGRKFGLCETTIRPCMTKVVCPPLNPWLLLGTDLGVNATRYPFVCGRCSGGCKCSNPDALLLPNVRVREVTEVMIDGAELDESMWVLRTSKRGATLVRLDDEKWPTCQDDTVLDGEVGSWTVSFIYGMPVTPGGSLAGQVLASEILRSIACDDECMLPERVQTVTRQGVTMGFLDPMQFLTEGMTGLYIPDSWIKAVNPYGLAKRPRARRADAPKRGSRVRSLTPGS